MHSKALIQKTRLTLDTMGMAGPVTRRAVAERVVNSSESDWALADLFDAKLAYVIQTVSHMMSEPLSQSYLDRHLPDAIPEAYRATLAKCPSFICISKRGGRAAPHVMAIKATCEQWEAYIDLKKFIEAHVRRARLSDQDILDLLRMMKVNTIEDLFKKAA
jgi:hypothetical protein